MIIERQSRTYFAPDDITAMQKDGTWSSIAHASLLPIDIKALQDEAAKLPAMPSDAELLDWARANHPIARLNARKLQCERDAAAAWTDYQSKMKLQGVAVPDQAPQYGGL